MAHAEKHTILYPLQHGFRRNRSCETQLLEMIDDLANNMQLGLHTNVCVIDFFKALDKVGHIRLVEKFRWYGIDGKTSTWIQNFLCDCSQSVAVEGCTCYVCVPEWSVLGPCPFRFYINDVADGFKSTVRLFADDTTAYLTKNPIWRTAAILKTVKSPYLCSRLTDFDEIWHSDACWAVDVKLYV